MSSSSSDDEDGDDQYTTQPGAPEHQRRQQQQQQQQGGPALHASDVFWDLLNSTTGYGRPAVYAFRDEWEAHSHRAAAAQRALKDPVAREEKESADAAAEVLLELERFDRRVTKPGRSQPTGKGLAVKPLAEPRADAASQVGGTLAWSDEAERVRAGELPPGLCGAEVQGAFRSLRLPRTGVGEIDLGAFSALTELDVSANRALGRPGAFRRAGLPPSLQVLDAADCALREPCSLPVELLHLGLGYNALPSLAAVCHMCPHLVSLDLAYNGLCDLDATLGALGGCGSLRHLFLLGNPLSLLPHYRRRVLRACAAAALAAGQTESLGLLDDLPVDPNAPLGGGDGTNPVQGETGPDGITEVLDADDDGAAPDRGTVNLWVTLAAVQGVPQPPPPPPSAEELAEASAAAVAAAAAGGKGGKKAAPAKKAAPPAKGGKAAAGGKGKGAAGGEEEEVGEFDHVRYFVRLVPPGQPASSGDAVAASLAATSAALDYGGHRGEADGGVDYGGGGGDDGADAAITTAGGGGAAAAAAAAAARALTGHTTSRMVYSASMEPGFAQTLALRPSVALRDDVLFNGFILQVFEETLAPRPTPPAEGSEAAEALTAAAAAAEAAEAAGEPPPAGWLPVQKPRAVQRVEMVGVATCRLAQLLTPQHPHEMVGEANTVRRLSSLLFASLRFSSLLFASLRFARRV
jgi:hypothetical protein